VALDPAKMSESEPEELSVKIIRKFLSKFKAPDPMKQYVYGYVAEPLDRDEALGIIEWLLHEIEHLQAELDIKETIAKGKEKSGD